ncbi:hypothetical protein FRB99_001766 [Tulasnella sp. 403]|nr:hypothetical protein FRB99_001766 [Tulasnella sp. 403]
MYPLLKGSEEVEDFEQEEDDYDYEYEGLETPTPYLQLPGITMKGEYDPLIGSELLFVDGRDLKSPSRRFVQHFGISSERIAFNPVRLKPVDSGASGPVNPAQQNDEPPPVLFQGRRKQIQRKETADSSRAGRKARGKPRKGRGGGNDTKVQPQPDTNTQTEKGKARAKQTKHSGGSDSEDDGDLNLDDTGSSDLDAGGAEPGPSSVPSRSSARISAQQRHPNLDLLQQLESMDVDDQDPDVPDTVI